jgi:AmmeMemoRadiSam system protein B
MKEKKKYKIIFIALGGVLLILLTLLLFYWRDKGANFHLASPLDKEFYETTYLFKREARDLTDTKVVAGIIPHHLLAGDLIANFFSNLEAKDYDLIILIGPNHFDRGESKVITSLYSWLTPYGLLSSDKNVVRRLEKSGVVAIETEAIKDEHAIYSLVSYIKRTFNKTKIVPLILRSNFTKEEANALALDIYQISKNKKVLVLASCDFSHYKSSLEAQQDDKYSLEVISQSRLDEVYNIAVDSPGAIYTVLSYANLYNAPFSLLSNSNSALLVDRSDIESTTSYITGYFGK